ncbi:MAG: tRNA (adenosine(37)-N6)-dimethylallyltransferase MiaA [Candidatus Saccharimonas sp.]
MTKNSVLPLIVITGPTASGKTALAIRLAKEFHGEIISADSRSIYKGLDIGTAKPSIAEQKEVVHWGIDLVTPDQRFTAADFKEYAEQKIADIRSRGFVPFLVGGTGLYIDAVIYDYQFCDGMNNTARRQELENMSLEALYVYCIQHNIRLPENSKNKRYVVNSILRNGQQPKRRHSPIHNTKVVGITTENSILRERIALRTEQLFTEEAYAEAQSAAEKYGWECTALTGNIYRVLKNFFLGKLSLEEAKMRCMTLDWRLAKRQLTWLRRNEHIRWLTLDEAYTYCTQLLAPHVK